MSKPISEFRYRLQEYMDETGKTQADIARETGIQRSTLSKYLSGKQDPRTNKIDAIAKTYGLDHAWLLGYDVPRERKYFEIVLEQDASGKVDTTMKARLLAYAQKLSKLSDSDRTMIEDMIDRLNGGDQNGQKEIQKT